MVSIGYVIRKTYIVKEARSIARRNEMPGPAREIGMRVFFMHAHDLPTVSIKSHTQARCGSSGSSRIVRVVVVTPRLAVLVSLQPAAGQARAPSLFTKVNTGLACGDATAVALENVLVVSGIVKMSNNGG